MAITAEQRLNPFPWYREMRERMPVAFFNQPHEFWSVFGYEDVQRVLSDYEHFSSRFIGGGSGDPLDNSLISTDPPRHRQLRALVSQAFTPRAINQLAPRIEEIAQELLDEVSEKGEADIVHDFAAPLPVTVIAELLGIPIVDRARFKRWSDAIVSGGAGVMDHGEAEREMSEYFLWTIEQHRENPQNDLISALLAAEIDGERLSLRDLLGFGVLLLIAGNETTTNLIGNAILCFDEQPDVYAELRGNPALLPLAIEEVLRYRSPVQSMFRTVAKDTRLGGKDLRVGQAVLAYIGSANHDEAQFPNADRFEIRRQPNRHIAFGHGIHFCLGAPLARLESKIGLSAILERLPNLTRVLDVPLVPIESNVVYGVRNLPVRFSATPRRAG